ncbi:MAG TPA: NAD(P)-dependent oxidoreductase [Acidimicrobiia bacterium]|nr:NAD(P)-dependent oxidoreductase [Acidimicrobiia bacterium]
MQNKGDTLNELSIGWIGVGRMGLQICRRLLSAGCDVTAYNRTPEKLAPLVAEGAKTVDSPAKLADRDIVFTMVADPDAFLKVTIGAEGLFSVDGAAPGFLIDSSTISHEASEKVRARAEAQGTVLLAAPVSGNPKVARAGRLTVVASGPFEAYERVKPYLQLFGSGVSYVGEGDVARLVKICHNLLLGVVTQSLAEITVLAEKAGVSRADFLSFINQSVMGSTFTKYKTPAFVNLDFTPTFTGHLLRKDFELGLEAGRQQNVPLPVAALVHQLVVALIGSGRGDEDFATMLLQEADASGVRLEPENVEVSDGLS